MSHELFRALAAWREDKSSFALAQAVDDASAMLVRDEAPKKKLHRWWTTQARNYDPVVVATLLAHLRWGARGKNVSWRTIILRDTPLVAQLREYGHGSVDAKYDDDWLNLLDRIGLMLTWPDDPRVAMALANLLYETPFLLERSGFRGYPSYGFDRPVRAAIAKRVTEIGDLRAIARVAIASHRLESPGPKLIAAAVTNAPIARTVSTLDDKLAALWAGVADDFASIERRLVLADALTERGDPRGELIALQCAPLQAIERARAAGETLDPNGLFGAHAEYIAKTIDTNWYRWLGEVALVVERTSRFFGGLLSDVTVGTPATPPWVWDRVADHHELWALNRLAPSRFVTPGVYARFVLSLARVPKWVEINDDVLAILRESRPLRLTGIRLSIDRELAPVVRDVLAIAPSLERLDLGVVNPESLPAIRALLSRLQLPSIRFTLENARAANSALLDEIRAMPNVFVLTYWR